MKKTKHQQQPACSGAIRKQAVHTTTFFKQEFFTCQLYQEKYINQAITS